MNVLTSVPIWVYFVIMAITFMFTHVVAYKPNKVTTRSSAVTTTMRIGSSVILLVGLLVMQPAVPVTLLLALALAALGGFLSGTAAPPPKRQSAGADKAKDAGRSTDHDLSGDDNSDPVAETDDPSRSA